MKTARMSAIMIVTLCLANSAVAGWVTSGNNMYSDVSGCVGIGTQSPAAALDVQGSSAEQLLVRNRAISSQYLYEGVAPSGYARIGAWNGSTGAPISLVLQDAGGNVGIGTSAPAAKLEVNGMLQVSGGSNLVLKGATMDAGDIIFQASTGQQRARIWSEPDAAAGASGLFLSSGDNTADISIYGDGGVAVRRLLSILSAQTGKAVLTLGEGLDYAEGFDVTKAKTEDVGPGSVLVIDENNAGRLTVSTIAYDTKVAGIVAGAKNLGSGVRLGAGQFDQNVALAGRVYCNVDATESAVRPGDLLTTSATPGYAMKVSDHVRALGAILGKAMESLEQGKQGQILVLVALQ